MQNLTLFGMRAGRLLAPADVEAGLACGCTCPGCGAPLIAKKGKEKAWHFSHANARPGETCAESAIHAAAKQVLLDHGALFVPEYSIDLAAVTAAGTELHEHELLSPARWIRFERADAEVTIGAVRPDVVGYRGERRLLFEMYFRHRVDDEKRARLRSIGLPALEIDLSDLEPGAGFAPVVERVIQDPLHKEWLAYPGAREREASLRARLVARVEAENRAYHDARRAQSRAKARDAERRRVDYEKERLLDTAFAGCAPAQQEHMVRQALGLTAAIPAYLCQAFEEPQMLPIPPFLWQGSIFAKFVLGQPLDGSEIKLDTVTRYVARRFGLHWSSRQALYSSAAYMVYLAKAGFLSTTFERRRVRFELRHNGLQLPAWRHPETRFHDAPPLDPSAAGSGALRAWRSDWPRWPAVLDAADELLAASPHRERVLAALQGLSALSPPATPHHWAEPMTRDGVPLQPLLELLSALGLTT